LVIQQTGLTVEKNNPRKWGSRQILSILKLGVWKKRSTLNKDRIPQWQYQNTMTPTMANFEHIDALKMGANRARLNKNINTLWRYQNTTTHMVTNVERMLTVTGHSRHVAHRLVIYTLSHNPVETIKKNFLHKTCKANAHM
jgi:hypothetical protein